MTSEKLSTPPGRLLLTAAFIAAVSAFPLSGQAAQKKAVRTGKVVDKVLAAADGVGIAITYYQSTQGKDAPVVIMLHMKGSNRLVWKTKGLAKRLQSFGYAVVTVDLRKHGESKVASAKGNKLSAQDYANMVRYDLKAVKEFILEEHHAKRLNIRKTAIISAGMSAPVAAVFAFRDWLKKPYLDAPTLAASTPRGQDIRALVFLSPADSASGLNAGLAYYKLGQPLFNVAVLVGYGKGDVVDRGGKKANNIFKRISAYPGTKSRMYLKDYNTKLRGTDMLGRRLNVETNIINFLNKHVKKLPDPWQDRHSRLN
jgi:pimeloyl-ACP methyl ester carboxylesterase